MMNEKFLCSRAACHVPRGNKAPMSCSFRPLVLCPLVLWSLCPSAFVLLTLQMRITNLNPDTAIGASGWFVEIEGHRLLMDAGVHPRREGRSSLPLFDLVKNEEADAIAISHCHHDHVGALPVAIRHFPRAHVLMSELSYFLVERVLHNSVNVMKRQRDELGIKEYPLFSHDEVDDIAPLFQG